MEAAAQGAGPPPRFLMMHWPVGTIRNQFIPSGSGTSYTTSKTGQGPGYIISPFDTPELRPHTIVLHGFNMDGIRGLGGGHEDGTGFATTGAHSPGTRANGGEDDDGCAGGPSWDQILLKNVPALSRRNAQGTIIGKGYYNTICDRRVDSYETSTRCLSYSYEQQTINSARPGGSIRENKPLLPEMSPLTAYKDLFSGFLPGATITDREALRLLKLRKSVLDYSLRELDRLKTLGPASEREKIDSHAGAVRKLEAQLSEQIAGRGTAAHVFAAADARGRPHRKGRGVAAGRLRGSEGQHVGRNDTRGGGEGPRRDHSSRVRLRPDPRGHLPVVAGHQPCRVQGRRSERARHDLDAPPSLPPGDLRGVFQRRASRRGSSAGIVRKYQLGESQCSSKYRAISSHRKLLPRSFT